MRIIIKLLICGFIFFNLSLIFALGRQEVIGYTTQDNIFSGPVHQYCIVDQMIANGIHICWSSPSLNPPYDENLKYNFYDFSYHAWNFVGGTNVFTARTGAIWTLDYDPITGNAVLCGTQTISGNITPLTARDLAPGTGLFEYCYGPAGYLLPLNAVTHNQTIHCTMSDNTSTDSLWYSRVQPWCNWSTPILICLPAPEPMYPTYNIQASKISNKVIITWAEGEPINNQTRGFYCLSNDGGMSWNVPVQIPFPPTFGDTPMQPSFHTAGFYAMFDQNDNFHIVTQVHPVIGSSALTWPAEIWHYCPMNNPAWSRIFHLDSDTIAGIVGYNALACCRPSLVRNPSDNYLYAVWEAFDPLNVEPTTGCLRADIWYARSSTNGLYWSYANRITTPNTTSKRFPCAGGFHVTPTDYDSLIMTYLIDSIAGFAASGQGRMTNNPVIFDRNPLNPGIEQELIMYPFDKSYLYSPSPNPFSSHTTIRFSIPAQSNASLEIYDVTGRLVKFFNAVSGELSAENQVIWNGKNNNDIEVKPGVYFYTLKTNNKTITNKIVKVN